MKPSPRLLIPFFTGLRNNAVVKVMPTCVGEGIPPRYVPVRVCDHLLGKLRVSNA